MRAYKVFTTATVVEDGNEYEQEVVRYAGTAADARSTREGIVNKFGVKKKDVTIEDAEIPTAKPDLLAFVNGLLGEE